MATPYSDTNSDDLANALFNNLTTDVDFTLPDIDLEDAQYQLGDTENNPLYKAITALSLDDLTTREPCGDGVFDALMEACSKHIQIEHEKGRITGTEYASAYVQMIQGAMSQAIQFLMGKDQAYWSALLVQAQAKTAEIAAIQSLVDLAKAKAEYAIASIGVNKTKADYALTKMELSISDVKYDTAKTEDQTAEYRLVNMLPVELQTMQEQMAMSQAQRETMEIDRDIKSYQLSVLLPDEHLTNTAQIANLSKQAERIDAEILSIEFDVQQFKPAQLLQIDAETQQISVITDKHTYELQTTMPDQHDLALQQIAKSTKEVEVLTFEIEEVKPVELAHLQAQSTLVQHQSTKALYEINTLLPDEHQQNLKKLTLADNEISKTLKDIEVIDYNITNMLPAQLDKMEAEVTQIGMQTNKISADRDNVVYSTNFLMPAQREGYVADTAVKNYQATQVLPAQVANTEADTLAKEYTRLQILPAQRTFTMEQMEAKRAETMNTRTDGAAVSGVMGKQKDLYTQQIESYKRDAEYKVGKMMVDTWITQRGTDDEFPVPGSLNNAAIDTVMARLKNRNDLT